MKYLKIFEDYNDELSDDEKQAFSHLNRNIYYIKNDNIDKCVLNFNVSGNDKIRNPYLSLPAGYTCPNASKCKTMAIEDPKTGRVKLKDFGEFRCYAANDEVKYPNTRNRNWSNYKLLQTKKSKEEIVDLLKNSFRFNFSTMPSYFRIHESGDFFNQMYFDAWLEYAKLHPETVFYAFTTSLKFWVKRLKDIPNNFRLTASKGGIYDNLITEYNLRYVEVVVNVKEAIQKQLKIDINDKLASSDSKEPFAILLHGGQKKGNPFVKDIKNNKALVNKLKKLGYN